VADKRGLEAVGGFERFRALHQRALGVLGI
jgi:hypothetical protein